MNLLVDQNRRLWAAAQKIARDTMDHTAAAAPEPKK